MLAHVFFNGEYDEHLTPENVQSIRNAVMLSESWMTRVDSGHLVFKPFEGRVSTLTYEPDIHTHPPQVYAVGTIDVVQEALRASTRYDWRVGGIPLETLLECGACSLDMKLLEGHARIVQAFLATGEPFIWIKQAKTHL
jgi:hypothetical protein